jgi:protein SCO1/2
MSAWRRITAAASVSLAMLACASSPPPVSSGPPPVSSGRSDLAAGPIAARPGETRSLFAAPWVFTDEQGAPVTLDHWRGAPIFVSMVFTNCTSACPLTIDKLREVAAAFKREGRPATFVLVTLDPTNDTPDQLRRFKASRDLPADWHLLRASDETTRALADLLQIKVVDNAHIFHDSRIVVFDGSGLLAGQLHG